jgi:hypothetical protein
VEIKGISLDTINKVVIKIIFEGEAYRCESGSYNFHFKTEYVDALIAGGSASIKTTCSKEIDFTY